MAKKRLILRDKQGNVINYDISAASITIDAEGKQLDVKLTELVNAIASAVKSVTFNGNSPAVDASGNVNLGQQMQADWNEQNTNWPSFIRNKPTIPDGVECDTVMSATSERPVQNKVIKAYVDAVSQRLNTLIGSGNVQGAIDTFNEVVAFLNGISSSDTLAAKLAQIQQSIPSVDGFVTEGDIPEKVSDLENDEGYVTADALVGLVAGSADFVMTEDANAFYITRVVPMLTVTELAAMSENTKSGTFKVSGTNLNGNVVISTSASGWSLSVNGGTAAQSITLQPTDGTLAETTINVAYSGTGDSVGNAITIASTGAESKSVTATYTEHAGPTITTSGNGISVSAIAGNSNTATVQVQGVMLTNNITAALSGANAGKFSLSKSTFMQVDGSVNETLTITYSPSANDSGTHSAILTLSSTGATSVSIALTGSVLTQSLSLSPKTLDLSSDTGVSATGTIKVIGESLTSDVALSVGSGFSVSPATIAAAAINAAGSTGVDVTVTADTTAASGTLTATSGSKTDTASLTWTQTETETEGAFYVKGGIHYKLTSLENKTCQVVNTKNDTSSKSGYSGSITIPATIHIGLNDYKVTNIADSAFKQSSVTSVNMSGATNITAIARFAFNGCTALSSLVLPPNLVTIGQYAFNGCTALTSVTIPDKVTGVADYAFIGCSALAEVHIGETDNFEMTTLGLFAFYNVTSIRDIYLRYNGSSVLGVVNTFSGASESESTLHVPSNATSAFTADTTYWGAWVSGNRIEYDLTPTN